MRVARVDSRDKLSKYMTYRVRFLPRERDYYLKLCDRCLAVFGQPTEFSAEGESLVSGRLPVWTYHTVINNHSDLSIYLRGDVELRVFQHEWDSITR